ncbi:MAG: hypothetical protein AAGB04_16295 [Pseudomonadota bacterium]
MAEAEDVLQRHADAINDRDLASYCETMNYPFTYQNYNGVALTIADAAELGVGAKPPWEIILQTDPDWSRTEFDHVEELASSVSSAVFKVYFRRVDTSGRDDGSYQAIWIVTCQQGRWGVQFRHNLGQVDKD